MLANAYHALEWPGGAAAGRSRPPARWAAGWTAIFPSLSLLLASTHLKRALIWYFLRVRQRAPVSASVCTPAARGRAACCRRFQIPPAVQPAKPGPIGGGARSYWIDAGQTPLERDWGGAPARGSLSQCQDPAPAVNTCIIACVCCACACACTACACTVCLRLLL